MPLTVGAIEAEALSLPISERARLIEKLILSLDLPSEVEEAWATEVERRNAEIESGAVSTVSGTYALAKLKAEFK